MMKKYCKEELIKNAPEGATHINYQVYSFNYILHHKSSFHVWMGRKHGGWSMELKYNHPNYSKLIEIPKKRFGIEK